MLANGVEVNGILLLLALTTPTHAQLGIPSICPYPVTYQMNKSTIIMPCNKSGFTDPESTKGWGIVDFDVRDSAPAAKPYRFALCR